MNKEMSAAAKKATRRLQWNIFFLFLLAFVVFGTVYILVAVFVLDQTVQAWLPGLLISSLIILLLGALVIGLAGSQTELLSKNMGGLLNKELDALRVSNRRARHLQHMASTLRATLSFERVVDSALDVVGLELEEMGTPRNTLVGAVFLFRGAELVPVATRLFIGNDADRSIPGKTGVIGQALTEAEPAVTSDPRNDPELRTYAAFQACVTAVCIPMRAGFQIFGAMVIGSGKALSFTDDHYRFFSAVTDQAVIALQNAQLYQQLTAEKQRLIEADEEARRELARDLHDGPTQSIAAIAMRINFIRSLIARDPTQAVRELEKVEELAKRTAKEIRGMLFTLRPLVLETQGLAPAIETVMNRIKESDGLNMRLVGGEHGDLLSESAQSVVFSIVEEALGNARKYSEADQVEVRLWQEDDLFVARIRDNGVGFDTSSVNRDYSSRGSLGMVNMRERAERIDGSLRVVSVPGKGTTVTLVVPLSKHGRFVAAAKKP